MRRKNLTNQLCLRLWLLGPSKHLEHVRNTVPPYDSLDTIARACSKHCTVVQCTRYHCSSMLKTQHCHNITARSCSIYGSVEQLARNNSLSMLCATDRSINHSLRLSRNELRCTAKRLRKATYANLVCSYIYVYIYINVYTTHIHIMAVVIFFAENYKGVYTQKHLPLCQIGIDAQWGSGRRTMTALLRGMHICGNLPEISRRKPLEKKKQRNSS